MSVATCHHCGRMISISMIPGGNPVALEEPERWAASYASCPLCHRAYCDRCMAADPLCPDCPGPPPAPSRARMASELVKRCQRLDRWLPGECLDLAWDMVGGEQEAPDQVRILQEALSLEVFSLLSRFAADRIAPSESTEPFEPSPELAELWASEGHVKLSEEQLLAWAARYPSAEFLEALAKAEPGYHE